MRLRSTPWIPPHKVEALPRCAVRQCVIYAALLQRFFLDKRNAMPTAAPVLPTDVSDRLVNLEIKASFTEDLLDKLDQIIIRQQDQIDRLTCEVLRLSQPATNQDNAPPHNPRDDLPPHY